MPESEHLPNQYPEFRINILETLSNLSAPGRSMKINFMAVTPARCP